MMKRKVEIICHACGYDWKTKSYKLYKTCPNCLRKTKGYKEPEPPFGCDVAIGHPDHQTWGGMLE